MNNFIKTTVKKLSEIDWPTMRDLFSWSPNGAIQAENPNLLVAKATDERGQTIAYVCAENILLVDGYVFSPNVTPNEAGTAGDSIDKALSQHAGVSRMWIVIPPEAPQMAGERRIRVVERKIYQAAPAPKKISYEIKHSVAYLN